LTGTNVKDTLTGGAGNDTLTGLSGNDLLIGNDGKDQLLGGSGNDLLTGGEGKDIFRLISAVSVDKITDFNVVDDTIQLKKAAFGAFATKGVINSGMLKQGLAPTDSNDFLIYNKNTGELFYDGDGSGKHDAAIQIALIGNHAALTAADFVVI
jgi:serralysin